MTDLLKNPLFYILLVVCFGSVSLLVTMFFSRLKALEANYSSLLIQVDAKICASHNTLEDNVEKSNKEVLAAIKELSERSVHINDCDSNKKLINQQYNAWIKMQEYKGEMDAQAHADIIKTMAGLIDQHERLIKCIHDMQKQKDCETL